MSHIAHGDDPNDYPSGELTPGTVVFFIIAFALVICAVLAFV